MSRSSTTPAHTGTTTALSAAMPIPGNGDSVPEWIHLLPAGTITTQDARGPYKVASIAALADQLNTGDKLAIDECHSTDLAAPNGAPAPARGWMTQFEARDDGLWAKVAWTGQGRALMEDQAYNGISPVILHKKDKTVVGVLRASLTNTPNLKGLTALHSQGAGMDWKTILIELLGLDAAADDAAIEAALKTKLEAKPAPEAATHAAQDIVTNPAFIALQGELAGAIAQLNAQSQASARDKAVAFVDGAIAEGRAGVKPARDHYIDLHMRDAALAETLIGAMITIKGAALHSETPPIAGDSADIDDGDRRVMQLMGINEEAYRESQAASGNKKAL